MATIWWSGLPSATSTGTWPFGFSARYSGVLFSPLCSLTRFGLKSSPVAAFTASSPTCGTNEQAPGAKYSSIIALLLLCVGRGLRRLAQQPLVPGEGEGVPAAHAAEHGDADLLRDLVAHLREARARDQERNAHLRALDHHLAGQPPGGVEHLVRAV